MDETIKLSESIRIVTAAREWSAVKKALQENTQGKEPVVVDVRSVQKMDSAGLQMILYLLHYQSEFPLRLKVTGIGDSLIRAFREHGYNYQYKENIQ